MSIINRLSFLSGNLAILMRFFRNLSPHEMKFTINVNQFHKKYFNERAELGQIFSI